jgi:hypothetical protein
VNQSRGGGGTIQIDFGVCGGRWCYVQKLVFW